MQKSTKEWTHSLTAVPFVRGHRSVFPSDSEKHRRVYTSSNVLSQLRVACWHGFRQNSKKKRNACLHAVRQAARKKKLRVYTASEAKGLSTACLGDSFGVRSHDLKTYLGFFISEWCRRTRAPQQLAEAIPVTFLQQSSLEAPHPVGVIHLFYPNNIPNNLQICMHAMLLQATLNIQVTV